MFFFFFCEMYTDLRQDDMNIGFQITAHGGPGLQ